jgi:hypothetical protein
MPEITEFDPRSINDRALRRLRGMALDRIMPMAGEFGSWLYAFCDREQYARAVGQPPTKDTLIPAVASLSSIELAGALQAITILSYVTKDESAGDFIDRMVFALTLEAATRLTKNE